MHVGFQREKPFIYCICVTHVLALIFAIGYFDLYMFTASKGILTIIIYKYVYGTFFMPKFFAIF